MAYIAKSTILKAYSVLASIDEDKRQGLTQKVSALKYGIALDMFFKQYEENCDLKYSKNKEVFASFVGKIVRINDKFCSKDFYTNIASNGRDYDCGSNFYSQSSVKDSKTNTSITIPYPKRSGWLPVMDIRNQVLIYNPAYIESSINFYLHSPLLKYALTIWLLRFENIELQSIEGLKIAIGRLITDKCSEALLHDADKATGYFQMEFSETECKITETDISNLFTNTYSVNAIDTPLQQIYYGAPGTGKSHEIKQLTEGEIVFRTTFHPDSDYSTFVGAYKPTTIEVPMRDVTGKVIMENGTAVTENRIVYEFVAQTFLQAYTEAWKRYASDTDNGKEPERVYLVIEEINRGNCAQIFGDLFQLLDRNDEGFSDYPINADKDLQRHLSKVFENMAYLRAPEVCGMSGEEAAKKIRKGEILLLPNNLYIWATMNTSDQSLFPIDSAFKRRWEWRYVKIKNHPERGYRIKLGDDEEHDWWAFLQKINAVIATMTSSADKQLGYFFCKAKGGFVSAETFVGKVLFYLWNDVFKDYGFEDSSLFRYTDSEGHQRDLAFPDFYDDEGSHVNLERVKDFVSRVMSWQQKEDKAE